MLTTVLTVLLIVPVQTLAVITFRLPPALRHCSTAKNFSVRNKKYFKLCINTTYWLSKIVESIAVTAFGAVLELLKNIKLTYPLNFAVPQCRPAALQHCEKF